MKLKDYISITNTAFEQSFNTWEDAVVFAGDLLIQTGCINETYRDDMVKLIRKNGPYIVVMPGVALAHARPNGNVFKNQIALVKIPQGISFGNRNNDPVYFLFAIAACSDEEHLELFKAVAEFLSDEQNLASLRNADCFEDIF